MFQAPGAQAGCSGSLHTRSVGVQGAWIGLKFPMLNQRERRARQSPFIILLIHITRWVRQNAVNHDLIAVGQIGVTTHDEVALNDGCGNSQIQRRCAPGRLCSARLSHRDQRCSRSPTLTSATDVLLPPVSVAAFRPSL